MDNLSSGGNFVAGRRPGGLSRWRPKSHLESQLLLDSNLKTVVGAAKINPSLGRIFVDSETNNAYLLTTDGNPAQCNKMVDKQTNASVGARSNKCLALMPERLCCKEMSSAGSWGS